MSRKGWALAAAALVAGGIIATGVVVPGSKPQAVAAQRTTVNTAQVERRTLSAMVSQAAILTYRAQPDGSPYSVINQARGTYTKLPAVGQVITQGQVLYRVDNRPVVLLHGATPVYRSLSTGTTGPDVAELNADLVALKYATGAQISPGSAYFGLATAAALEKLQAAVGMTRTGVLALGQAVFEPVAMRVTTLSVQLGSRSEPGQPVMQATSTTRQIQMALDAAQQASMKVGDRVTITLPNNHSSPGVVSSVASVATCPPSSGQSGSGSGSAAPGTDACTAGGSGSGTPTVAVDVTPSDAAVTGRWDRAPVQIVITTGSVRNALVVPVTTLLARAGGGYAVEVVGTDQHNRLVPVSLGLFDDAQGLVQVTGSGLAPGQAVVVPAT